MMSMSFTLSHFASAMIPTPFYGFALGASIVFCFVFHIDRSSAAEGHFWHLTDLHWDPTYKVTSDPNLVCDSNSARPVLNAGKFGDHLCDSPLELIKSSINAMKDILPNPDFIIWTGDDTPHVPNENLGEEAVLAIVANLTILLKQAFPESKVYSALGNHDYHPKSQLPPGQSNMYEQVAQLWQDWLEPESQNTFRAGGYYTETLLNKMGYRVLVLNTNLYYDQNKLTAGIEDPAGQFEWMDKILTSSAINNEKVYLVGHVPPGVFEKKRNKPWFQPDFNRRYIELIQKHHAVLAGQFFGHHHTDSFRMFYNLDGHPISVIFLTPGVSPWKTTLPGVHDGANNPGIRVFEYDNATLLVKDLVTYYLNLSYANTDGERWEKEYRLCEAFRVPDASPSSMQQVLERVASQPCYLQRYYELNSVSYDLSECDANCRVDHVCAMREVDLERYQHCLETEGVAAARLSPLLFLLPAVLGLFL